MLGPLCRALESRAGVAEQADEEIGEEVGEDLLLFEPLGATAGQHIGPVIERRAAIGHVGRQVERPKLLPQNVGTKQRFGFGGHGRSVGLTRIGWIAAASSETGFWGFGGRDRRCGQVPALRASGERGLGHVASALTDGAMT